MGSSCTQGDNAQSSINTTGGVGSPSRLDAEADLINGDFGDKEDLLKDHILESLAFLSMKDREEEVSEAHEKTLEWMFEREKTNRTRKPQRRAAFRNDFSKIIWVLRSLPSNRGWLVRSRQVDSQGSGRVIGLKGV